MAAHVSRWAMTNRVVTLVTRTGWDMDPFVVISFGKKVFRTRVIRHSLNPTWEEKLLFHVRRYETAFKVQLTVLDWDKLSSNDHVGDARFDVAELVKDAPQPDPKTGLYGEDDDGSHPMKEFHLPLVTAKEMPWEAKYNPVLQFRSVSSLFRVGAFELNLVSHCKGQVSAVRCAAPEVLGSVSQKV